MRANTAHSEQIRSYQEALASLNEEVRGDIWIFQVQLPLLSLSQPPALQLHGRIACPAYDLPQDVLPSACMGQVLKSSSQFYAQPSAAGHCCSSMWRLTALL